MHTKTSATVLRPLADAVSALIVIISDSEISKTPTPDLSALSKAVDAQIKNLVNVAKKIVDQPAADPTLKENMPPAYEHVSRASNLLLTSTSILLANPNSSEGRQTLLEAVKGILEGTTRILDVFDDSEIHKICRISKGIREILSSLKVMNRTPENNEKHLHAMRYFSQNITLCIQISIKRVKEINSDQVSSELVDAIKGVEKDAPELLMAAKIALLRPDSLDAGELFSLACERMITELQRIENVVSNKPSFFDSDSENTEKKLQELSIEDVYEKSKALLSATKMSDQWKESAANTRNNAKVPSPISNPAVISFPKEATIHSARFLNAFEDLLEESTLDLNEARLEQDTKEIIDALDAVFAALDANEALGVISELISLLGDLSSVSNEQSTLGRMHQSFKTGDLETSQETAQEYSQKSYALKDLISYVLDKLPRNNQQYAVLKSLQNRASSQIPVVVSGAKIFHKFGDEVAKKHVLGALETYTEVVTALQKILVSYDAVFNTDELLLAGATAFNQHVAAQVDHVTQKKVKEAKTERNFVTIALLQALSIAEKEKENSEDPVYRASLEKELQFLVPVSTEFITRSNQLVAHIGHLDTNDVEEYKKTAREIEESISKLSASVRGYKGIHRAKIELPILSLWQLPPPSIELIKSEIIEPPLPEPPVENTLEDANKISDQEQKRLISLSEKMQDAELRNLSSAIKDLVIVNEEAPILLSATEAEEDPMKAAGQELKVEASHWATDQNPIVLAVTAIGEKFLALSLHHKELSIKNNPESKKAFIQTAQEILVETGKLHVAVEPLIKACADRRLVSQITQTASRTNTLAQTLKVIAAVKASSPRDTDRGVQLISNGQNLVASVKTILRDAISCSLRLKKDAPPDLVRFKKVIYAKTPQIALPKN